MQSEVNKDIFYCFCSLHKQLKHLFSYRMSQCKIKLRKSYALREMVFKTVLCKWKLKSRNRIS
jgi:hypothetical protein